MEKKIIVLHIGYPKTATTSLQKHYSLKLETNNYLGKYYNSNNRMKFVDAIADYLSLADKVIALLRSKDFSENLLQLIDERSALISKETNIGSFFNPRLKKNGQREISDPVLSAETIKVLFDEELFVVKILITLRRQDDAIVSKYAQSFQRTNSYIPNLNTFEKFISDIPYNDDSYIRSGYDYYTISSYERMFGRSNIKILPFELFKADSNAFLDAFWSFLQLRPESIEYESGKQENVRPHNEKGKKFSKRSVYHLLYDFIRAVAPEIRLPKQLKKLKKLKRFYMPIQKDPGRISINEEQSNNIMELYIESNKKLSYAYELNLENMDTFN